MAEATNFCNSYPFCSQPLILHTAQFPSPTPSATWSTHPQSCPQSCHTISHLAFFHQSYYLCLKAPLSSPFSYKPCIHPLRDSGIHIWPPRSSSPCPLSLSPLLPPFLPFSPRSSFTSLSCPLHPSSPRAVCMNHLWNHEITVFYWLSVSGNITLRSVEKWPGAIGVTLAPPLFTLPTPLFFCIKGTFVVQKQKKKSR